MDNYNALYNLITLYNALYMKALSKELPFLFYFFVFTNVAIQQY